MVQYWKNGDQARAKLITINGSYAMEIEGEKYPLWGFPRGPVLFGPLARLKKMTKELLFNHVWKLLDEGQTNEEIMGYVKHVALSEIMKEIEKSKYDFFPSFRMCPAVQELYRAMEKIGLNKTLKEGICFFFQEDDAYRFRFQWIAKFANPRAWWKRGDLKSQLSTLFNLLSHAEITPDMRGRVKLIQRVLSLFFEDKEFGPLMEALAKELNWKKLYLSKADSYYFRGKYFLVDYDHFDY